MSGGLTYWMFGYGLSYGEDAGTSWFSGMGSWFVGEAGPMQVVNIERSDTYRLLFLTVRNKG